eukprot:27707-Pyramimonas_sp.AAC.1
MGGGGEARLTTPDGTPAPPRSGLLTDSSSAPAAFLRSASASSASRSESEISFWFTRNASAFALARSISPLKV